MSRNLHHSINITPPVDIELDELHKALSIFRKVIISLHSTLNTRELCQKARSLITELFGINSFAILIYDASKKKFVFNCSKGISKKTINVLTKTIESEDFRWQNIPDNNYSIGVKNANSLSCFSLIPLESHSRLVSVFTYPEGQKIELTDSLLSILSMISLSLLVAYNNSYLYNISRRMAIWDEKTNLYNHRYFLKRLSNEISRARRYGRPLSLIILDIDNFKSCNDEHGHLVGDKVLRELSKNIKLNIRSVDIPARFGGDEFLILLPETDFDGAKTVANRLEESINSQAFSVNNKKIYILSVTLGISSLSEKMTAKELLETADMSLIRNKAGRKNGQHKSSCST